LNWLSHYFSPALDALLLGVAPPDAVADVELSVAGFEPLPEVAPSLGLLSGLVVLSPAAAGAGLAIVAALDDLESVL
jgi:hypothetical protein